MTDKTAPMVLSEAPTTNAASHIAGLVPFYTLAVHPHAVTLLGQVRPRPIRGGITVSIVRGRLSPSTVAWTHRNMRLAGVA